MINAPFQGRCALFTGTVAIGEYMGLLQWRVPTQSDSELE